MYHACFLSGAVETCQYWLIYFGFFYFSYLTVIYSRAMGLNLSYATVIKEILTYHPWMQQAQNPLEIPEVIFIFTLIFYF